MLCKSWVATVTKGAEFSEKSISDEENQSSYIY